MDPAPFVLMLWPPRREPRERTFVLIYALRQRFANQARQFRARYR